MTLNNVAAFAATAGGRRRYAAAKASSLFLIFNSIRLSDKDCNAESLLSVDPVEEPKIFKTLPNHLDLYYTA